MPDFFRSLCPRLTTSMPTTETNRHVDFCNGRRRRGRSFSVLVVGVGQRGVRGVFPLGTLVVNVLGSFVLGFGLQAMEAFPVSAELRTMLTIGFLGAFTTFSTFSYETVGLIRDGDWTRATLYTGLSVVLSVAAVLVGIGAASVLLKVRG